MKVETELKLLGRATCWDACITVVEKGSIISHAFRMMRLRSDLTCAAPQRCPRARMVVGGWKQRRLQEIYPLINIFKYGSWWNNRYEKKHCTFAKHKYQNNWKSYFSFSSESCILCSCSVFSLLPCRVHLTLHRLQPVVSAGESRSNSIKNSSATNALDEYSWPTLQLSVSELRESCDRSTAGSYVWRVRMTMNVLANQHRNGKNGKCTTALLTWLNQTASRSREQRLSWGYWWLTQASEPSPESCQYGKWRLCRGGAWHSNLTKIILIYNVSYFDLGGIGAQFEG